MSPGANGPAPLGQPRRILPAAGAERNVPPNALHHFADPRSFLTEARRVLEPGGAVMIVGLDPHTGSDQWCIYDYFAGTRESDRQRYPAAAQIRAWMAAAGFTGCRTAEVEHLRMRFTADEAFRRGQLDRSVTSQLTVLGEEEYRAGIRRIRATQVAAEARGESLHLTADLRLYATYGSI